MADPGDVSRPRRFGLKDLPGTTIALTSLALLGAAAVVTTPVWLWYRRKRKRTDALLRRASGPAEAAQPPAGSTPASADEPADSTTPPGDTPSHTR